MDHVPYVNARREVKYGALVSELYLAGEVTKPPESHVVHFAGDYPCDQNGQELARIRNQSQRQDLDGVEIDHSFSSKPQQGGYADHYEKMTTYARILAGPAAELDPTVSATPFPPVAADDVDSPFTYVDTASSRAGIAELSRKLELGRVGIIGLGGTGSYVLDLVAKTPVREIHLFDRDRYSQHNAFRSPGAASLEDLGRELTKVDYLKDRYARMHRGVVAHPYNVDATTVDELRGFDFVFLCLDDGEAKRPILAKLDEFGLSFIDVGMGILVQDGCLGGILRVTASTPSRREHIRTGQRIPFTGAASDDYSRNIQVADLNCLNAALAVIKWKKLVGFYRDLEHEHHATYTIDGNCLLNEDSPCSCP